MIEIYLPKSCTIFGRGKYWILFIWIKWHSGALVRVGIQKITSGCRRLQGGHFRDKSSSTVRATAFSPTVSDTPKILSTTATHEFEVPQPC